MIRRTPRSTRTDTLFPYTTLFRSRGDEQSAAPLLALPTQGSGNRNASRLIYFGEPDRRDPQLGANLNLLPQWTEKADKSGLDPLGIQNIGVRLYQALLPGISKVTLRMRYY